jgi:hypothetical protein
MNISPRLRSLFVVAASVPLLLAMQPSWLDARTKDTTAHNVHVVPHHPPPPSSHDTMKETMNAWTVSLVGGLIEGIEAEFLTWQRQDPIVSDRTGLGRDSNQRVPGPGPTMELL